MLGGGGGGWNDKESKFEQAKKKYSYLDPGFRPPHEQTDTHPAVLVSWNDASKFARWLDKTARAQQLLPTSEVQKRWTAGLPTEAQWEYACRAGSTSLFAFGDNVEEIVQYGNVADQTLMLRLGHVPGGDWKGLAVSDKFLFTAPVASFKPNAFGLHDMHGNVWEWCEDPVDPEARMPSGDDPLRRPIDPKKDWRALRGGSWWYEITGCRSAFRRWDAPYAASCEYGFRVCIVLN
jgi:sulfatase modifying factor 1